MVEPDRTTSTGGSRFLAALLGIAFIALPGTTDAQSLAGSQRSMDKQVEEAARHDYSYVRNPKELRSFVDAGYLVPVSGSRDYVLKDVSFPYARREVRELIELMAEDYHDGCGEQLVVTSLTRPQNRQPRNASRRSVHPTGMALDLRRSSSRKCHQLLEQMLLRLETHGVLDATLERMPYHYHVAVFPRVFREVGPAVLSGEIDDEYYVVRGDTLFKIARQHGTSVEVVRSYNGLRGTTIYPGQKLRIPVGR
jgi:hypothetical protein